MQLPSLTIVALPSTVTGSQSHASNVDTYFDVREVVWSKHDRLWLFH